MKKYSIVQQILLTLIVAILLVSCTTYERILATPQSTPVELGMIGDLDATVTTKEFQTIGLPSIAKKIRLQPIFKSLNALDYKAYTKLKKQEALGFEVTYVDSLPNKPEYVRLRLQDKSTLLSELNSSKNKTLRNQILNNKSADIVSQIDWVISEMNIQQLKASDAVYLSQNVNGIPNILISKDDQITELRFSDGVVLSYEVSQFCWGLNYKNEAELMAISEKGSSCTGPLKRNGTKLKKDKNLFNY